MKVILLFLFLALNLCCLSPPAVKFEGVKVIMGPLQVAGQK